MSKYDLALSTFVTFFFLLIFSFSFLLLWTVDCGQGKKNNNNKKHCHIDSIIALLGKICMCLHELPLEFAQASVCSFLFFFFYQNESKRVGGELFLQETPPLSCHAVNI